MCWNWNSKNHCVVTCMENIKTHKKMHTWQALKRKYKKIKGKHSIGQRQTRNLTWWTLSNNVQQTKYAAWSCQLTDMLSFYSKGLCHLFLLLVQLLTAPLTLHLNGAPVALSICIITIQETSNPAMRHLSFYVFPHGLGTENTQLGINLGFKQNRQSNTFYQGHESHHVCQHVLIQATTRGR